MWEQIGKESLSEVQVIYSKESLVERVANNRSNVVLTRKEGLNDQGMGQSEVYDDFPWMPY